MRVAILGGGCTTSISDIQWFTVPQCDIFGTGMEGADCIGWVRVPDLSDRIFMKIRPGSTRNTLQVIFTPL